MQTILTQYFKRIPADPCSRGLGIVLILWCSTVLFTGCKETVSFPAGNCTKMIKETVSLFDRKGRGDHKDGRMERDRPSLGSIRFDLLSLFVLVHSRQDIAPEIDDDKVIENKVENSGK